MQPPWQQAPYVFLLTTESLAPCTMPGLQNVFSNYLLNDSLLSNATTMMMRRMLMTMMMIIISFYNLWDRSVPRCHVGRGCSEQRITLLSFMITNPPPQVFQRAWTPIPSSLWHRPAWYTQRSEPCSPRWWCWPMSRRRTAPWGSG